MVRKYIYKFAKFTAGMGITLVNKTAYISEKVRNVIGYILASQWERN